MKYKFETEDLRHCQHEGRETWAEYDARGIYLCRVCRRCVKAQLARYRPEVLRDPRYISDEPIDADNW